MEALNPRREDGRNPLIQILFTLQNFPPLELELDGIQAELVNLHDQTTRVDWSIVMYPTEAGLDCRVIYATCLFDHEHVQQMLDHWTTLLHAVVAAPDTPILQLPMLDKRELKLPARRTGTTHAKTGRQIPVCTCCWTGGRNKPLTRRPSLRRQVSSVTDNCTARPINWPITCRASASARTCWSAFAWIVQPICWSHCWQHSRPVVPMFPWIRAILWSDCATCSTMPVRQWY